MRLHRRVLWIVLAATATLALGLHFLLPPLWLSAFEDVERALLRQDVERVSDAVSEDLDNLRATALDWSLWDDAHDFVTGTKPEFVEANLQPGTVTNLRVDVLAFFRNDGSLLHSLWSEDRGDPSKGDADLIRRALAANLVPAPTEGSGGLFPIGGSLHLLTSVPVLRTDGSGPAAGTLIIARDLDEVSLSRRLSMDLEVRPLGSDARPLPEGWPSLENIRMGEQRVLSDERLAQWALLAGPTGDDAAVVQVSVHRPVLAVARDGLLWLTVALITFSTVMGLVVWMLLQRFVVGRVGAFSTSVAEIGRHADLTRRLPVIGRDEFSSMSTRVNTMLDALQAAEKARDASDRAMRESEDRARESQKLEAVGRLAGGIAHDFNNLLVVVIGYADLLETAYPGDERIVSHARAIHEAGERAATLTRQLLAFSRRQPTRPRVVDPAAALRRNEPTLRRLLGASMEIRLDLADPSPRIRIDPGQLLQVLLNLLLNARDSMVESGRVTVTTRSIPSPDSGAPPWLRLEVEDTGTGIAPDVLPRIFEPFFTTKEQGKGSGLGLATVHGIVLQNGGSVHAENVAGGGARFVIEFPGTDDPADEDSGSFPAASPPPVEGEIRVLLVEDDPTVRRISRSALETAGYRVREASGAVEALTLDAAFPDTFNVLVTDVMMPGMNGFDLARTLREKRPELRVVFMSGYSPDLAQRCGEDDFLAKPFGPADLVRTVGLSLSRNPRVGVPG